MPRIKVWSSDRKLRVAVTFENFNSAIEVVLQKASQKLNKNGVMLVAEEDGISIMDMDDMEYYSNNEKSLILLEAHEIWSAPLETTERVIALPEREHNNPESLDHNENNVQHPERGNNNF